MKDPVFSLVTDFGAAHWFSGVLKAKIWKQFPSARIIDLCHEGIRFNTSMAAVGLNAYWKEFPLESIFIIVIDPGVGGQRLPLAAKIDGYYFVFPESNLLSLILNCAFESEIVQIETCFIPSESSATFHGKDLFVPAALSIAQMGNIHHLGSIYDKELPLFENAHQNDKGQWIAKIIGFDHFGNVITNFPKSHIKGSFKNLKMTISGQKISLKTCFSDVELGIPTAYFGSMNFLEAGINQGDMGKDWNLAINDLVVVEVI